MNNCVAIYGDILLYKGQESEVEAGVQETDKLLV